MSARVYLAMFIPYFIFSFGIFLGSMKIRNYPLRGVWIGTALAFGGWWTFMRAAITGAFTTRQTFSVTPKGSGGSVPLKGLIPQVTMFGLCCVAVASGLVHILFTKNPDITYYVTSCWAAYHASLLGTLLFYFNRPVTMAPREMLFVPVVTPASLVEAA